MRWPTARAPAQSAFEPTIWYSIDRDGIVTVNIIRAEMGQHVGTALARILADELEADWSKVRIDDVDSDPRWGYMVTGGSWSVWMTFPVFSRAGAAGRIALIEAGAKLLGVPADQCTARNGAVIAGSRSISYGEIVARGDLQAQLHAQTNWRRCRSSPRRSAASLATTPTRIDIPAKTNGTARYGIDAAVDGMVYARPKIPPTRNGSRVRSIDDSAAKSGQGLYQQSRARGPVRYRSRLGHGVREFLSGRHSRRRPRQGRLDRRATVRRSPSRTFSTMARRRSPIRRAAPCWWTIRGSMPHFRPQVRPWSEPIRPAACCTASSSRSMRLPSKRTASSRSTPAISGRA